VGQLFGVTGEGKLTLIRRRDSKTPLFQRRILSRPAKNFRESAMIERPAKVCYTLIRLRMLLGYHL
jgi:hypothetical protein